MKSFDPWLKSEGVMALLLCGCMRKIVPLLGCAILLGFTALVYADPKPLSKEEQAKIDRAIDKGVAFLKRTQRDKGDWRPRHGYVIGETLLAGYALLESDVPVDDLAIRKVTDLIRPRIVKLDRTYEVALATLFLDRLGDPKDAPLIRSLGMRLIAGQHVTGGWNYRCPILRKDQEKVLCEALGKLSERLEAGEESRIKLLSGLGVPPSMTTLPVFRSINNPSGLPWQDAPQSKDNHHKVLYTGTTDNSNTQFAMLGLWAAQRHGIPVGPTFHLMAERFERTQAANGWWLYLLDREPNGWASPSMICVGLMGLAIGRGLNLTTSSASQPGAADLRILKGLVALSQDMGEAAARIDRTGLGSRRGLYYLWSVERVAALYHLPTIGDKDWYRWGATILLVTQQADGGWKNVAVGKEITLSSDPTEETAFALLFLKRSHPMKELTPKLPFKGEELNRGIVRLLGGIPPRPSTTTTSSSDK